MKKLLAVLASMAVTLLATGAAAQPTVCEKRAAAVKNLQTKYQERVAGRGLSATGNVVELWISKDGATWTITVTTPRNITCGVGAGTDWMPGKGGKSVGTPS